MTVEQFAAAYESAGWDGARVWRHGHQWSVLVWRDDGDQVVATSPALCVACERAVAQRPLPVDAVMVEDGYQWHRIVGWNDAMKALAADGRTKRTLRADTETAWLRGGEVGRG